MRVALILAALVAVASATAAPPTAYEDNELFDMSDDADFEQDLLPIDNDADGEAHNLVARGGYGWYPPPPPPPPPKKCATCATWKGSCAVYTPKWRRGGYGGGGDYYPPQPPKCYYKRSYSSRRKCNDGTLYNSYLPKCCMCLNHFFF